MVESKKEADGKSNIARNVAIGAGVVGGAVLGFFALPMVLTGVGLSAAGPVAGGLFALAEASGGAIATGSVMAVG